MAIKKQKVCDCCGKTQILEPIQIENTFHYWIEVRSDPDSCSFKGIQHFCSEDCLILAIKKTGKNNKMKIEDEKTTKNLTVYQCPYCKYTINENEYLNLISSNKCPQCGCPLTKFKKRNIKDIT